MRKVLFLAFAMALAVVASPAAQASMADAACDVVYCDEFCVDNGYRIGVCVGQSCVCVLDRAGSNS